MGFCIYECQLTAHILTVGQRACFFVFVLFCTSKADLLAKKCWKYLWIQTSPWTPPGGFYPTNHIMKIGAFTHITSSQFKIMGKKRFSLPFCIDGRNFNLGPVGLISVDMVSLQFLSLWKMCSGSWLSDWLDPLLLLCEQRKKKGIEWFSIADSKYLTLCNNVYRMNLVLSFWNTHYFQITKVIVVGHHL